MIIQGTAITGTTVSSSAATVTADSYFNLVALLLPGNGTNGAQNNTFQDSSTNNFTVTRNGNTTQGTFSPFSQTGWSNYFDGVASTPMYFADNDAFTFNADFTVEAWVYLNNTSAFQVVVGKWDVGTQEWLIGVDANGVAEFHWAPYSVGGPAIESSSGAVLANQWTHIAAVRSGSTITLYVNGISVGTRTNGTAGTNYTSLVTVGYLQYLGGDKLAGYVSNLRIVKGTAVYTGAFTPSSVPLTAVSGTSLLTCQTNRFVDNSTNNFTPVVNSVVVNAFAPFDPATAYAAGTVGGSAYFDGSGDYLNVASNSAFTLGSSGDFTVECWCYLTATPNNYTPLITTWTDANSAYANRWAISIYGSKLSWFNDAGGIGIADSSNIGLNQWIHVAAVRSGSTITLYKNGVSLGTQTTAQAYTTQSGVTIGFVNNGGYITGWISNARVVKGTAVYTGAFTPPTTPVTAIANTQLLLNYTNAGITDATAKNVLETVGDAKISTAQSKFSGSSMLFDGTGDWLLTRTSPNLDMGTGDLTIEGWFYLTTAPADYQMIVSDATNGNNYVTIRGGGTGGQIEVNVNGTSFRFNLNNSVSANTWFHLAVTRSTNTWYGFINGTSLGNTTNSGSFNLGNGGMYVGRFGGGTAYAWPGYMDDLRITRGYARYTANFTPPTTAFPTQ